MGKNREIKAECRLIRSRRKSLEIKVFPSGEVVIRAPERMPETEIWKIVEKKADWIGEKLADFKLLEEEKPGFCPEKKEGLSEDAYRKAARIQFEKRAAYFAEIIGKYPGKICIRDQKTRWGSCSSKGNLNFNWRLILAPPEILDYVVVHELCHLWYMNHSREFWSLVERVLPDYKERKKWLAENGRYLKL